MNARLLQHDIVDYKRNHSERRMTADKIDDGEREILDQEIAFLSVASNRIRNLNLNAIDRGSVISNCEASIYCACFGERFVGGRNTVFENRPKPAYSSPTPHPL